MKTASATPAFNYQEAFSRNIGLVNEEEQGRLRKARVALAGLGGVGGAHLQVLARLGVGAFHLADPDIFESANTNRQLGATVANLRRHKAEVSEEILLAINPQADVVLFRQGITPENIDEFLKGVDVVVDGIEFFAMASRQLLFSACRRHRIPVVNAGPIGYGAALMVFQPEGPSFEEHFQIEEEMTRAEKLLAFGLGLGPGLERHIDPRRLSFKDEKGPALATACMLCAALAGTEVLKLIIGRGTTASIPNGLYVNPLVGQVKPLQRPPSLLRSEEGRQIREAAFRQYPDLAQLHEEEVASRKDAWSRRSSGALQALEATQ